MRIIAGKFRSRPLLTPKGWKTRPTSDRLRETLFNVLGSRIEGAIFADLFAGTGAVGLEALSRGAKQVYFAETGRAPLAALRSNLERFEVGSEAQIESTGSLVLLRRLARMKIDLDVAFLDPPYSDASAYSETLEFLDSESHLSPQALVIAEHARRSPLQPRFGNLQSFRIIEQGEAAITFFECIR